MAVVVVRRREHGMEYCVEVEGLRRELVRLPTVYICKRALSRCIPIEGIDCFY